MDELILRVLQGRAEDGEKRSFEAWLNASPENRARFEEIRRIWGLAEGGSPPVRSMRRPAARELLGERIAAGRLQTGRRGGSPYQLRPRWHPSVAAAVAAVAAAAVIALGAYLVLPRQADPFSFEAAEFSTGPRETVTVRLSDGTIVRLAPSTSLQIDGAGRERSVWLDGDAFFAVAHRAGSPFTVRTQAGTATVLGTRFDVSARPDNLRLVVVDGRVRVEGPAGQHAEEVGPSEMSRVIEDGRVYVSQVPDVYSLLDWMEGALIFQTTPLERVAEELEYRYGVPVEMVDPVLAKRTITAWFSDEPLESAVRVICRAADVRCEVSENGVRVGI